MAAETLWIYQPEGTPEGVPLAPDRKSGTT